jgi:hypothetical protein
MVPDCRSGLLYGGGLDPKRLQRFPGLFFRVRIAGISARVNGLCMREIARNLTDAEGGLLKGKALPDS